MLHVAIRQLTSATWTAVSYGQGSRQLRLHADPAGDAGGGEALAAAGWGRRAGGGQLRPVRQLKTGNGRSGFQWPGYPGRPLLQFKPPVRCSSAQSCLRSLYKTLGDSMFADVKHSRYTIQRVPFRRTGPSAASVMSDPKRRMLSGTIDTSDPKNSIESFVLRWPVQVFFSHVHLAG